MGFDYKYVEKLRPGENQYDGIYDLDKDTIVEARYIPSKTMPGNPFIEALPAPWSMREIMQNYTHPISIPTEEELAEMDEYEREDNIDILLDTFRVQLPFHAIVEKQFHRALIRSYNKRRVVEDQMVDVKLHVEGKEIISHNKLKVKHMSDPVGGFTLLGSGGCGKSTGVNMMLSHYPQTIVHAKDTWQRTYQIVYLLVQCTPNSNFSKLYENIGEAIDDALCNFNPVYKNLFQKGGLGEKYNLLKELVMKFNIGCLILDEIELMDVRSNRESSLEALLTLTNETGVAISVIGTLDAYKNLFFKARTARRMGVSIIASRYCAERERFGLIASMLTLYQWGNGPTEYTKELIDALFDASNGVISDLVEIYKLIQKDRVRLIPSIDDTAAEKQTKKRKKFDITPEYIHKKSLEYYELLQQARALEKDPTKDNSVKRISEEIQRLNTAAEAAEIAQMEKRYDEVMADDTYRQMVVKRENVKLCIKNLGLHFNENYVDRAFSITLKSKGLDAGVDELTAATIAYLQEKQEQRRSKTKPAVVKTKFDISALQEALKENNENTPT
ncbi:MAG: ATP-binding protein [Parasporobacterium sp.]|nr:ATP-binding protein [Parasporobacterium sp.]